MQHQMTKGLKKDGTLYLDPDHACYYQVQFQLFVCDVNYCDFCVATFADSGVESAMHVEHVYRNPSLWCVEHASSFFRMSILPELMGSYSPAHPLIVSWSAKLYSALCVKFQLL